ncbi:MAG: hypothetical protein GY737_09200 [Desulfobacteraceae bacterium]|nr:hypothetical protein [Desulfobacteraceae bacterium]
MDLGLKKIVNRELGFLESVYGFKCVKSGPWLVRYQSKLIFIDIRFDGERSYELGCEIGRNDNLRESLKIPFNIGEIIRSKGYSPKDVGTFFQITNSSNSLERFVKRLADYLKTHAQDLLDGSDESFNLVADFREKECEAYALETDLKYMRSQLDLAWKNNNYKKVVELLAPLKATLKQSELKKLNYALKKEGKHIK